MVDTKAMIRSSLDPDWLASHEDTGTADEARVEGHRTA
jgi:hypothetical protein